MNFLPQRGFHTNGLITCTSNRKITWLAIHGWQNNVTLNRRIGTLPLDVNPNWSKVYGSLSQLKYAQSC